MDWSGIVTGITNIPAAGLSVVAPRREDDRVWDTIQHHDWSSLVRWRTWNCLAAGLHLSSGYLLSAKARRTWISARYRQRGEMLAGLFKRYRKVENWLGRQHGEVEDGWKHSCPGASARIS